jgi:hypothetical protein
VPTVPTRFFWSFWWSSFVHTGINVHFKPKSESEAKYEIGYHNSKHFHNQFTLGFLHRHGLGDYWIRKNSVAEGEEGLKTHTLASLSRKNKDWNGVTEFNVKVPPVDE